MKENPKITSALWNGHFEKQCTAILKSTDRLLGRYPKSRHRSRSSRAVRILSSVLLQLQGLEAFVSPEEQQQLAHFDAAFRQRLGLLQRRRIPPCPELLRLRSHYRELSRKSPPGAANWDSPSVLVGSLRRTSQLDICLTHGFYHIPAGLLPADQLPIAYVAIYQSRSLFPEDCGICFYGQVKSCSLVQRWQISEIPKDSNELYYRLDVVRWEQLDRPIAVREIPFTHLFTNLFLLTHSQETPELCLRSPMQYRLYQALRCATELGCGTAFRHPGGTVRIKNGLFLIYRQGRRIAAFCAEDFLQTPASIFQQLLKVLEHKTT